MKKLFLFFVTIVTVLLFVSCSSPTKEKEKRFKLAIAGSDSLIIESYLQDENPKLKKRAYEVAIDAVNWETKMEQKAWLVINKQLGDSGTARIFIKVYGFTPGRSWQDDISKIKGELVSEKVNVIVKNIILSERNNYWFLSRYLDENEVATMVKSLNGKLNESAKLWIQSRLNNKSILVKDILNSMPDSMIIFNDYFGDLSTKKQWEMLERLPLKKALGESHRFGEDTLVKKLINTRKREIKRKDIVEFYAKRYLSGIDLKYFLENWSAGLIISEFQECGRKIDTELGKLIIHKIKSEDDYLAAVNYFIAEKRPDLVELARKLAVISQ